MERMRLVMRTLFGCCGGNQNSIQSDLPIMYEMSEKKKRIFMSQECKILGQEDLQKVLIILNYYKLELYTFLPQAAKIINKKNKK